MSFPPRRGYPPPFLPGRNNPPKEPPFLPGRNNPPKGPFFNRPYPPPNYGRPYSQFFQRGRYRNTKPGRGYSPHQRIKNQQSTFPPVRRKRKNRPESQRLITLPSEKRKRRKIDNLPSVLSSSTTPKFISKYRGGNYRVTNNGIYDKNISINGFTANDNIAPFIDNLSDPRLEKNTFKKNFKDEKLVVPQIALPYFHNFEEFQFESRYGKLPLVLIKKEVELFVERYENFIENLFRFGGFCVIQIKTMKILSEIMPQIQNNKFCVVDKSGYYTASELRNSGLNENNIHQELEKIFFYSKNQSFNQGHPESLVVFYNKKPLTINSGLILNFNPTLHNKNRKVCLSFKNNKCRWGKFCKHVHIKGDYWKNKNIPEKKNIKLNVMKKVGSDDGVNKVIIKNQNLMTKKKIKIEKKNEVIENVTRIMNIKIIKMSQKDANRDCSQVVITDFVKNFKFEDVSKNEEKVTTLIDYPLSPISPIKQQNIEQKRKEIEVNVVEIKESEIKEEKKKEEVIKEEEIKEIEIKEIEIKEIEIEKEEEIKEIEIKEIEIKEDIIAPIVIENQNEDNKDEDEDEDELFIETDKKTFQDYSPIPSPLNKKKKPKKKPKKKSKKKRKKVKEEDKYIIDKGKKYFVDDFGYYIEVDEKNVPIIFLPDNVSNVESDVSDDDGEEIMSQNLLNGSSKCNSFNVSLCKELSKRRKERRKKSKGSSYGILENQKKLLHERINKNRRKKYTGERSSDVSLLSKRQKKLRFGRSPIHEWGLFALEQIKKNEFVVEYCGEVIRSSLTDIREKRYELIGMDSSYLFRLDSDYVIDATFKGNIARFINHCCDPNCSAKIIYTGKKEPRVAIYALKDIEIGEEVTYDYKFDWEEEKIKCECGAKNCRGTLN